MIVPLRLAIESLEGKMKRFALAVGVAALAVSVAAQAGAAKPGPQCGGPLWKQLTLADNGKSVNWNPKVTTLGDIAKLVAPARITAARSTSFQRQVWRLDDVVIERYRLASNGELALELFDTATNTYMNAYVPARQKSCAHSWESPPITEMTSNTAPSTYAVMGKSVNGGCVGLPDHPRRPLNVRPRNVRVGRNANLLIGSLLSV